MNFQLPAANSDGAQVRGHVAAIDFQAARARVRPYVYHTPLLTSQTLNDLTGFDVRLKAEMFQRTGSYKIRGPLNKFHHLTAEEKARGVV